MTAGSAGAPGAGGALQPVAPALLVRVVIRPMTKVLNPVIIKFAGRKHFAVAAQIHHVGRRSAKAYVTPATARLHGDVIVVALTFGNQSDWARNVRAVGGCWIRLNGRHYHATNPEFVSREDAGDLIRSAFSPLERASLRLLGIRQFMRLHAEPAPS
jgi:deazaflavin-dependent oxidoreductase (nitroreductase family)